MCSACISDAEGIYISISKKIDPVYVIGDPVFRTLIDNSKDLILLIGRDGIISFANKATTTRLSWTANDLIGCPVSKIIPTLQLESFFPNSPNSSRKIHNREEWILPFLDRRKHEVRLKCRWESFLEDPAINGFLLRGEDVQAHREAEEEQRYEQDLFTAAFQINTAMCSITDPVTGEILDINEKWATTFGYSREEVIGKSSLDLDIWIKPENRERAIKIIKEQGRLQDFEQVASTKDGSLITVLASAETVKIGSYERLLFSMLDITHQRKMEEEHKYQRDLFAASFRVNNALCSITKPDTGEILDVNELWLDTLGYTRSEVIGRRINDLHIWHRSDQRSSTLQELRKAGRLNNQEHIIRTKTGALRTVSYSAEILNIGGLERLFSSARDVTDERDRAAKLQESEERLRQSQKMEAVGQLTGGIAHDFNNLLSIVIGNAEMIEEVGGFDKQIDAIMRASLRGAELTRNLLAFSRKQNLAPVNFALDKQLERMLKLLPRTLDATITIKTEIDPNLWTCYADPGQVENVLLNLALNARDAMPDGGILTIHYKNRVMEEKEFVSLLVQDTGCGMDAESLQHILEPFYTTKKVGEGSGLGLSMVSGFAEQSDGYLFVNSTIGKGTHVELYLPRSKKN